VTMMRGCADTLNLRGLTDPPMTSNLNQADYRVGAWSFLVHLS
jgi:hypothetical protein